MAETFKEQPTVASFGLPTEGNRSVPVLKGYRMKFSDPVRPEHFPPERESATVSESQASAPTSKSVVHGRKLNIFGD